MVTLGEVNHHFSGKSSLILSLLNLISYTGSIHVDGVDIATVPRQVLRSSITTITQETLELDGTVRYNLLSFKLKRSEGTSNVHDADIMDVLCRTHLWDYIVSHGGLDVPLADLAFSSGQKQLLSISRAVLHNRLMGTKIVLMDEPTSSLDMEMDRRIQQQVFADVFGHCTLLMVAHRLETIPFASISFTVEMAEGSIVHVS